MSKPKEPTIGAKLVYMVIALGWILLAAPLIWIGIVVASALLNTFIGEGMWFMATLMCGTLLMIIGMILVGLVDLFHK